MKKDKPEVQKVKKKLWQVGYRVRGTDPITVERDGRFWKLEVVKEKRGKLEREPLECDVLVIVRRVKIAGIKKWVVVFNNGDYIGSSVIKTFV